MILVRWFGSKCRDLNITMSLDVTVTFSQSTYSVSEGAKTAQIVLILSNPSSTDITVVVYNTNGIAFGEY